jgi:hypothetical protein
LVLLRRSGLGGRSGGLLLLLNGFFLLCHDGSEVSLIFRVIVLIGVRSSELVIFILAVGVGDNLFAGRSDGLSLSFLGLGKSSYLGRDFIGRFAIVGVFSVEIHHLVFHILLHLFFVFHAVFLRVRFLIDGVSLFLDRVLVFVGLSDLKVSLQNFLGLLDLLSAVGTTIGGVFLVVLITVEHLVLLLVALSLEVTTKMDFGTLSSDLERVGLGHIHVASDSLGVVLLAHNG